MKTFALAALVTVGFALPAFAQGVTFEELDTDANGELSYEEIVVIWPQMTEEQFTAADLDASGGMSADEVATLQAGAATTTTVPGSDSMAPAAPTTAQ